MTHKIGTLVYAKLSLFLVLGHYVFNRKRPDNVNKKTDKKRAIILRMLPLRQNFYT
jgi:hypothetical protein